jgi:DNA-binding NarL/FixJ family response regulator
MKTRILLVDDHRLFREGLRALIDARTDMEVVGEAGDGREAVSFVTENAADIVVMDVTMPNQNGIEATRLIKAERPNVRIIALSGHAERRLVVEMLRAGASGYALKEGSFADLVEAIAAVSAGRLFVEARVADELIADYLALADRGEESPLNRLTDRELEVLQRLAEGKTTKEIAFELKLSVKTVETHRQGLMDTLDIHSIARLTKFALHEGLTPD